MRAMTGGGRQGLEQQRETALLLALFITLVLLIAAQLDIGGLPYLAATLAVAWFGITRLSSTFHLYLSVGTMLACLIPAMLAAGSTQPFAYPVAGYGMLLAGYLLGGGALAACIVAAVALSFACFAVFATLVPPPALWLPVLLAGGLLGHLLRQRQVRMEREHAAFAEHNRHIVQQMPAGLLLLDYAYTVTKANAAAAAMLGTGGTELLNRTLGELPAAAPLVETATAVFRKRGAVERTVSLAAPGGARTLQVRANLTRDALTGGSAVIMLLEDVTELRRMEEELARTERLAAVGQLAASVAHEINNPVSGVLGYVRTCLEEGQASADDLRVILQGVEKVPPAVKKLLDLTKPVDHRPELLLLAPLAAEAARLYARQATVHNTVGDAVRCYADAAALAQALANVVINAAEATGPGGTVTITATADAEGTAVAVTDNGPGIPAELLPRLFDPFVTTRRDRGGTGLGLAMVARIMERHGGRATVDTRPGETRFTLHFPAPPATKE